MRTQSGFVRVLFALALFVLVALAFWTLGSRHARAVLAAPAPAEARVLPMSSTGSYSYADVVDHVAPGVVTIRSARRVRAPQQFPFFNDPFFRQFFGRPNGQRQDRPQVERALGSGVIIAQDGHILTNHHVVDGAE